MTLTTALTIEGTNLHGDGEIVGWMTQEAAAEKFAVTPSWATAANHASARGRCFHVGGGLWVSRCRECDTFTLSWGALPAHAYQIGIGEHEVLAHGLTVPGINVGLLP